MQIKCTKRIAKEKLIFFPSADVRPVADETVAQFDGIVCRLRTTETPTVIMDPRRGSLKAKQMIGDTADLSGNPQKLAPRKTKDETPKKIPAAWTFAKKKLGPFSSFPPLAPPRRPWSSGWKICLALWELRLSVSEHVLAGWRGLLQLAISRSFTVEFRVFLYRSIALELLYFESFECNWIWFDFEIEIGPQSRRMWRSVMRMWVSYSELNNLVVSWWI